MRVLTLRKSASLTLVTEGKMAGCAAYFSIFKENNQSTMDVLEEDHGSLLAPAHYPLRYIHYCDRKIVLDLWIPKKDVPENQGDYWICPSCKMVGLRIEIV